MDIEEIKKIVFDVLKEAGLAIDGKAAVVEEIKKEVAEEKLDRLEDAAERKAAEAVVESMTAKDEKDKEVKNAACGTVKDEVKNEVCDEVKEEVIKAEVLNQKPTIGLAAKGDADKWRSMNSSEFIKYIDSGAYKKDL